MGEPQGSGRSRRLADRQASTTSGLLRYSDILRARGDVSNVPILLHKSFWSDERKFLEPLMRLTSGDVRDHIVSSKIDHGPL